MIKRTKESNRLNAAEMEAWSPSKAARRKIEAVHRIGETYLKLPGSCGTKYKDLGIAVDVANCDDCNIFVLDVTSQVQVDECNDCRMVIGPVSGSVFIRDCKGCTISVAARQVRLRNVEDCELRVYVPAPGAFIVETSANLHVRAWDVTYPHMEDQFQVARFPDMQNDHWKAVYDFSPDGSDHWQMLPEIEQLTQLEFTPEGWCGGLVVENCGGSVGERHDAVEKVAAADEVKAAAEKVASDLKKAAAAQQAAAEEAAVAAQQAAVDKAAVAAAAAREAAVDGAAVSSGESAAGAAPAPAWFVDPVVGLNVSQVSDEAWGDTIKNDKVRQRRAQKPKARRRKVKKGAVVEVDETKAVDEEEAVDEAAALSEPEAVDEATAVGEEAVLSTIHGVDWVKVMTDHLQSLDSGMADTYKRMKRASGMFKAFDENKCGRVDVGELIMRYMNKNEIGKTMKLDYVPTDAEIGLVRTVIVNYYCYACFFIIFI